MSIDLICLDADDTLWHHETFFRATAASFAALLAPFADGRELERRVAETEHRNLALYGYGVKGFVLSLIETATNVCGDRLPPPVVRDILGLGRDMMRHPIDLIDGVPEAVVALKMRAPLVLVTKGDLFHQETKLAASGLGELFDGVEVVSSKTAADYRRVVARHGSTPARALMAGNSMRSDVLPALEAGAHAALVPHPLVWDHEAADPPAGNPRYRELARLGELPGWIDELRDTALA